MSKITLIYMTYRPGGLDLLAYSLQHQDPSLYELIIVDDWPGRVDRGIVANRMHEMGIPLYAHLTPKEPTSEFRKKIAPAKGLANAMNTGALFCRTPYMVFVQDFVWLPPGAVAQWHKSIAYLPRNTLISGIASIRRTNPPECYDDWSLWTNDNPTHHLLEEEELWTPMFFENFYMGVPASWIEKVNGFDERVDEGKAEWILSSTYELGCRNGMGFFVDKRLSLLMVSHRSWLDGDVPGLWHASRIEAPLTEEPEWQSRSPNAWDFVEYKRMCP